jgi:acetyl esterase
VPIDPQVRALLDAAAARQEPPLHSLTVAGARELMTRLAALGRKPEPVADVEDREVPGPAGPVRIRVYVPAGRAPHPVLVYFHGGGWVTDSIDTHDRTCRSLTNAAGCVTVSVGYRCAPEHRFPAAPEDCYAAVGWVAERASEIGGDAGRVAVGGESAGGTLATVAAVMARDRGGPRLLHQVLLCSPTDHYGSGHASYEEFGDGYLLTRRDMVWFWNHYLGRPEDADHPYASPLRAGDLSGLPPATIVTAEFDPLRDEGEAYGARLKEAGVSVDVMRYPGMVHGFVRMDAVVDAGRRALEDVAARLHAAYGGR